MFMEPKFYDYINGFNVEDLDDTFQLNSVQYPNRTTGFEFIDPSPDLSFVNMNMNVVPIAPSEPVPGSSLQPISISTDVSSVSTSTGWSLEGESLSPSDESNSTDPVLKYITQMLMEENLEEPHMFNDYLALKDTEQSLYEVLVEQYPQTIQSPHLVNQNLKGPECNLSGCTDRHSNTTGIDTSNETGNYIDHHGVGDNNFQSTLQQPSLRFPVNSTSSLSNTGNGTMESTVSELLARNIFDDKESVLQFQRGFEEASNSYLVLIWKAMRFLWGKRGTLQMLPLMWLMKSWRIHVTG
ncbi:GRAS family transcription factor isoform 3 [Hibiscus syriacus]|uniref:GRAS family transcription factor isoform 3 n=1 Tax=Hibiscus syriacus TaxID=106335 RepID=A0A6A3D0N9_HIBSY|nr:GRAS family transcription factor isoform 3 [Hibiscus syriacus]